jgi:hypothetical protein
MVYAAGYDHSWQQAAMVDVVVMSSGAFTNFYTGSGKTSQFAGGGVPPPAVSAKIKHSVASHWLVVDAAGILHWLSRWNKTFKGRATPIFPHAGMAMSTAGFCARLLIWNILASGCKSVSSFFYIFNHLLY